MKISKEFTFDSCHNLPFHQGKCKNQHGHTYKLIVTIQGELDKNGLLIDFGDLKSIVNDSIIEVYDHKNLNDFFPCPTAEIMAQEFFKILSHRLPIYKITLYETPTSWVEVYQEDL